MKRTSPFDRRARRQARARCRSAAAAVCRTRTVICRRVRLAKIGQRLEALDCHARSLVAGAPVKLDRKQAALPGLGGSLRARPLPRRRRRSPTNWPLSCRSASPSCSAGPCAEVRQRTSSTRPPWSTRRARPLRHRRVGELGERLHLVRLKQMPRPIDRIGREIDPNASRSAAMR